MKKKIMIIVAMVLSVPILTVVGINVLNWISFKTNVNLNPIGIGNEAWFLFIGCALNGICSIIAMCVLVSSYGKEEKKRSDIYNTTSND